MSQVFSLNQCFYLQIGFAHATLPIWIRERERCSCAEQLGKSCCSTALQSLENCLEKTFNRSGRLAALLKVNSTDSTTTSTFFKTFRKAIFKSNSRWILVTIYFKSIFFLEKAFCQFLKSIFKKSFYAEYILDKMEH